MDNFCGSSNGNIFKAIETHYKNTDHFFKHHMANPALDYTCVAIPSPCYSNPCGTGDCTVNGQDYTCSCPTGFSGDSCEYSPCNPENGKNPCLYSGKCSVTTDNGAATGFTCECKSGFSGDTCDTETPCTSNPCKNDGVCTVTQEWLDASDFLS